MEGRLRRTHWHSPQLLVNGLTTLSPSWRAPYNAGRPIRSGGESLGAEECEKEAPRATMVPTNSCPIVKLPERHGIEGRENGESTYMAVAFSCPRYACKSLPHSPAS